MTIDKKAKMNKITRNDKILIATLDHGLTIGPVDGLKNIDETINNAQKGGASAILTHKGIMKNLKTSVNIGKIVHLSASTNLSVFQDEKVIVGNVENAIKLGADAISIHINIGSDYDQDMLVDFGQISDECDNSNIPLIAMMYPRGEKITDPYDTKTVSHVARIGAELGADIVKTVYTGSVETFREVVESCPVPIIRAGGSKVETDKDLLKMVSDSMEAGAVGVSFGRNIFEHKTQEKITRAIASIIFEKKSVEQAMSVI
ncbi:MAG: 2-amino-3,7-dideoxy-D-threo-hept-6-ulosonate synthase [Thermoproteota archaeon]